MPLNDGVIVDTTFRVRFAETDQMGIVHHAAYIVWFEEGRSAYTREAGVPYAALEELGYSLAVSEIQARYIFPARYDQAITVRTCLTKLGSRGLTFVYEVVDPENGQLLVSGSSRHICVDHAGDVRRFPPEWLDPITIFTERGELNG